MDWNMGLVVVVAAIKTLQITPGLFEPTWRAVGRKLVNRCEQNLADCGHEIYHIVINCFQNNVTMANSFLGI